MREPRTEAEFHAFRKAGRGMIYAHLTNRLHTADCDTLCYGANRNRKRLFDDLEEARAWLNRYRQGWQECPQCKDLQRHHTREALRRHRAGPGAGATGSEQGSGPQTHTGSTDLARAYALLDLLPSASLEDAEAMYRSKMKRGVHPDKGGTNEGACRLTGAIETIRKYKKAA
jgi:hypothetical protein